MAQNRTVFAGPRRADFRAAGALALSAIVVACGGVGPTGTPAATALHTTAATTSATASLAATASAAPSASPTPGSGLPDFHHVYLIVMENKEYGSIVGSSAAPYLNQLISRYGSATDLYAETHPSEPNYIALTSGGLQGTNSDGTYDLSVANLFDQVEASGRSWHVYAQGYPAGCYRSY